MPKHPHAELMALYAQDAMETDQPWERWEIRGCGGDPWVDCARPIAWSHDLQYRRKPRTITINGYEVPEPVTEPPKKEGQSYWVIHPFAKEGFRQNFWYGAHSDLAALRHGLVHLTEEAARVHAEALLSFTKKSDCEQGASPPPSGSP